ncbi:hypothetical protein [Branchiibius cervicis]|uniref:Uncharacterized protein n=1 Tax=Branchiibius cervicis TaxID=908252 RepID=A0ABW2AQ06_9MICO
MESPSWTEPLAELSRVTALPEGSVTEQEDPEPSPNIATVVSAAKSWLDPAVTTGASSTRFAMFLTPSTVPPMKMPKATGSMMIAPMMVSQRPRRLGCMVGSLAVAGHQVRPFSAPGRGARRRQRSTSYSAWMN